MHVAIYKLRFPNGVHVGAYGIGTEGVRLTIPADTLFAALLSSWVFLGKDSNLWADQFPRTIDKEFTPTDPPFLLTSAFPYFADGVLLFPKPNHPDLAEQVPEEKRKDWKKLAFVSERCLIKLRKGTPPASLLEEGKLVQGKSALVLADEHQGLADDFKIWEERQIPRVALDRVSSASNLYQVGRVDFTEGCGLWFGVIWLDPERPCGDLSFKQAFELALEALSHSGLGGERTYGYGIFKHELLDELNWPDPSPGSPALLLSRYLPRPDELPDVLRNAKGYTLEEVRGWAYSPHGQYRRRAVTMVAEGSVLTPTGTVMGHVRDVGPIHVEKKEPLLPHPVWRYGLAALWPLGGGE